MTDEAVGRGPSSPPGELPEPVYRRMAEVLRVGLVLALGILAASLIVLIVRRPGSSSEGWISSNALVPYLDLRLLATGLAAGAPEAYLTVGVFALIATPVVRVITGMCSFYGHGESRMGLLSAAVLVLLLMGLLVVGPLIR